MGRERRPPRSYIYSLVEMKLATRVVALSLTLCALLCEGVTRRSASGFLATLPSDRGAVATELLERGDTARSEPAAEADDDEKEKDAEDAALSAEAEEEISEAEAKDKEEK